MSPPRPRARTAVRYRGGPLVMLALLLAGWSAARMMWWEYPFDSTARAEAREELAEVPPAPQPALPPAAPLAALVPAGAVLLLPIEGGAKRPAAPLARRESLLAAIRDTAPGPGTVPPSPLQVPASSRDPFPPPFLPPPLLAPLSGPRAATAGRWSLDAWAFWRQGSASTPVSQGRVPIYGASQTGAVLQYRLAPSSRHDPRLYARAYRALVRQGETEGALGASLRPLGGVPLRLAGEVRYTEAAFFNDVRPAAYAVTEIAPLRLPFGTSLEVYGQAGWVGGRGETPFADAQANVSRELPAVARWTDDRLRLSLGAGAWGGAQKDAGRADIGPILRLDTRIGQVPARVAIDWRLRVAGDASPGSGVAATVSAGF